MSVQELSGLRLKVAEALKVLFELQKKKPYAESFLNWNWAPNDTKLS